LFGRNAKRVCCGIRFVSRCGKQTFWPTVEDFVQDHRLLFTEGFVERERLPAPPFLGARLVGEFELGDSVQALDNLMDRVDRAEDSVNPLT